MAMTVGEVVDILNQVERHRTIYVPDTDGTAQPVAAVIDLKHVNLGIKGIFIPDDIALVPVSILEETEDDGL